MDTAECTNSQIRKKKKIFSQIEGEFDLDGMCTVHFIHRRFTMLNRCNEKKKKNERETWGHTLVISDKYLILLFYM